MLTLESFEEAAEIVKQVTQETKLVKSSYSPLSTIRYKNTRPMSGSSNSC